MQTVLSRTGIEVCYPCTVHLLNNGENFECEYKSDHTGRDLLNYLCKIQNIQNRHYWGLKYMDSGGINEQRYWLDLDKLIRSQVKHICPIRFYFRVKVYPPEPYKIDDQAVKHPIFQQLRLDLLSGRLFCESNDAAMLTALVLQYIHGNFTDKLGYVYQNYMREKIIRKERCLPQFYIATQKRALDIYQNLLTDLPKLEIEDLLLRLACKLESYGVEPFLVRNIDKLQVILWMNFNGLAIFNKKNKTHHFSWMDVSKVTHQGNQIFVHLVTRGVIILECVNNSECNYIWSIAMNHLVYFTSRVFTKVDRSVDLSRSGDYDDRLSQITSFISTCVHECHCNEFNDDNFIKNEKSLVDLQKMKNIFADVNLKLWRSQISFLYAIFILYVMGSQTTIFSELPCVESVKDFVHIVSKFVCNKMLSF